MDHRLGVDIGGTFTDVALDSGGRRLTAKVLTTPAAPERGSHVGFHALLGSWRSALASKFLIAVLAAVFGLLLGALLGAQRGMPRVLLFPRVRTKVGLDMYAAPDFRTS